MPINEEGPGLSRAVLRESYHGKSFKGRFGRRKDRLSS